MWAKITDVNEDTCKRCGMPVTFARNVSTEKWSLIDGHGLIPKNTRGEGRDEEVEWDFWGPRSPHTAHYRTCPNFVERPRT